MSSKYEWESENEKNPSLIAHTFYMAWLQHTTGTAALPRNANDH